MAKRLNDAARKLLEGKNFAFVATVNRDGSPQVTPTWVDTDGTHVLVNTVIGRVKQWNTKRDARVTITVAKQTNPYEYISIRGRVVEQITGPQAEKHIDKLAKKYMGVDSYPNRKASEPRVILKVEPERVSGNR